MPNYSVYISNAGVLGGIEKLLDAESKLEVSAAIKSYVCHYGRGRVDKMFVVGPDDEERSCDEFLSWVEKCSQ